MRRNHIKRLASAAVASVLMLTSAPFTAIAEDVYTELTAPYTFTFEDSTLSVEAQISRDSVFELSDARLRNKDVFLDGKAADPELFAALNDCESELCTVDLNFCTKDGEQVDQVSGSTELTLTIPESDENAVIKNVEVFRYSEDQGTEEALIERIPDATVNGEDRTVSFDAGELSAYAVRYTVDYYYKDQEYHMTGGEFMLLSELFDQLSIRRDAADVVRIDFTNDKLVSFTRYDDGTDWIIQSLCPFSTEEEMTVFFSDGYKMSILVTDDPVYAESDDLSEFMANWKLMIGDAVYSDDTVTDETVIFYKPGMQYQLELYFYANQTYCQSITSMFRYVNRICIMLQSVKKVDIPRRHEK